MTDYSTDARVRQINQEFGVKRTRFFIRFALVEGFFLALAVVLVYVMKVVEPEVGIFAIVGVAFLGSLVMVFSILRLNTAQQTAIRDVGGNPGPQVL